MYTLKHARLSYLRGQRKQNLKDRQSSYYRNAFSWITILWMETSKITRTNTLKTLHGIEVVNQRRYTKKRITGILSRGAYDKRKRISFNCRWLSIDKATARNDMPIYIKLY